MRDLGHVEEFKAIDNSNAFDHIEQFRMLWRQRHCLEKLRQRNQRKKVPEKVCMQVSGGNFG